MASSNGVSNGVSNGGNNGASNSRMLDRADESAPPQQSQQPERSSRTAQRGGGRGANRRRGGGRQVAAAQPAAGPSMPFDDASAADALEHAVGRVVHLSPDEYTRQTNAFLERSSLTRYPPTLFDAESGMLNHAGLNLFPNDHARYTQAFLASIQTESYYRERALPDLVRTFPLLRERDDFTDLQIDVTLAPLLTVSVADALEIYPRARNVVDRQRSALEELTARSKLLVSNLESLFAWSFRFRKDGMTLIALSDEYEERRNMIGGQMYSIRSKVINDELRKLIDKVKKAEANFNQAKRRHTELFRREVAERKRAIDLLTNYLSGTLLRVGGNLNQINPRYDVSVRGTPFESKIGQLIPLYRRLRTQLIQHRLLRPLVDQIIQYVRASPDLNKNNFLLQKYF